MCVVVLVVLEYTSCVDGYTQCQSQPHHTPCGFFFLPPKSGMLVGMGSTPPVPEVGWGEGATGDATGDAAAAAAGAGVVATTGDGAAGAGGGTAAGGAGVLDGARAWLTTGGAAWPLPTETWVVSVDKTLPIKASLT